MPVPQETQWAIEEHTKAKHAILRSYLGAWFAILMSRHTRVVYVDGFCGPGRYSGGEPGSPLIALEVARSYKKQLVGDVVFLFTDKREDRILHLRQQIAAEALPPTFHVHSEVGEFHELFAALLDDLDRSATALAPAFVFVDPFGFSKLPFSLIERILKNGHAEVFITFMVNAVQRFIDHPLAEIRAEIVGLFGTEEVASVVTGSGDRTEALRGLYQRQLSSRARFVRSFEVRDVPGRPLYHLFFASNHPLGHLRMKEAMWAADPSGGFRFVDDTDRDQLVLLQENPVERLVKDLARQYSGKRALSDDVLRYVADETPFVHRHARAALKLLEQRGAVQVGASKASGGKRKKGTFPDGTVITFT